MTQYEQVREFMLMFGQECPRTPEMPGFDVEELRVNLIDEEAKEFRDAENITEAFDAILDLLYVVQGAAIAYGISEVQLQRGFYEVHRSNMSKLWNAVELDSEHFKQGYTSRATYWVGGNRYIVKDASGKIIKSPSYSPANLRPILEGVK